MNDLVNKDSAHNDLIPEDVRSRLANLAGKLEEERRNLDEARLLREAEVKALKTELTQRDNISQSEKKLFENDLARMKKECLTYQEKEQEINKKQSNWEAERSNLEYKLQQQKNENERLMEQLRNNESVWKTEKLTMEQVIRNMERDIANLKNEYQRKMQEIDGQYQERLNKEVDELERLLIEAREAWQDKTTGSNRDNKFIK
jgi:DNA repair exonuclease SbcCD ATPase subunit